MLCLYRLPLLSACFVSAFCGSLLLCSYSWPETRRSRRQPKAVKEHTPKDASDAEHVCASCCDVVGMVSSRCSGQRAPPAIFLYQFTSVLRSLVVETTAQELVCCNPLTPLMGQFRIIAIKQVLLQQYNMTDWHSLRAYVYGNITGWLTWSTHQLHWIMWASITSIHPSATTINVTNQHKWSINVERLCGRLVHTKTVWNAKKKKRIFTHTINELSILLTWWT